MTTPPPLSRTALNAVVTFALFAVFGVFLRLAREEVSVVVTLWARFFIGAVVLALWCIRRHPLDQFIPCSLISLHARRITVSLFAFVCFAYAAPSLPVSEMISLQFSIPIMLAFLARIFLNEQLPWVRIVAMGFGVLGVLLVARPSGGGSSWAAATVLAGCLCAAYGDLQVKKLSKEVPAELIALYLMLAGAIVFSTALPLGWQWPSAKAACYLLGLGVSGTIAQVMLGQAFARLPASAIAPFVYTSFLWSLLLDFTIWGFRPDPIGLLGAICIMVDGVLAYWSLYRDQSAQKI